MGHAGRRPGGRGFAVGARLRRLAPRAGGLRRARTDRRPRLGQRDLGRPSIRGHSEAVTPASGSFAKASGPPCYQRAPRNGARLDAAGGLASLSGERLNSPARSPQADEDARAACLRRLCARRLQRAGAAGLGPAGARLRRGDAARLPIAGRRRLLGEDRALSRGPGQRPLHGSCRPVGL